MKCQVRVYWGYRDVSGHACGREIKTAGAEKCNVHLGADKRKAKNDERRRAEMEERLARMQERNRQANLTRRKAQALDEQGCTCGERGTCAYCRTRS